MSCPQFIAESMALRTAAHLAHLSSESYAQHVANLTITFIKMP